MWCLCYQRIKLLWCDNLVVTVSVCRLHFTADTTVALHSQIANGLCLHMVALRWLWHSCWRYEWTGLNTWEWSPILWLPSRSISLSLAILLGIWACMCAAGEGCYGLTSRRARCSSDGGGSTASAGAASLVGFMPVLTLLLTVDLIDSDFVYVPEHGILA